MKTFYVLKRGHVGSFFALTYSVMRIYSGTVDFAMTQVEPLRYRYFVSFYISIQLQASKLLFQS